jgi:hypothetical protein
VEENNKKPLKEFSTKKETIIEGTKLAKQRKVELVIHNKDNKISDKESYGNDPKKIKDKKH